MVTHSILWLRSGNAGLAESVVAELEVALNAHELIKVRLPAIDRTERAALAEQVVKTTGAQQVQSIGRIILIYRQRPQEEKLLRSTRDRNA